MALASTLCRSDQKSEIFFLQKDFFFFFLRRLFKGLKRPGFLSPSHPRNLYNRFKTPIESILTREKA